MVTLETQVKTEEVQLEKDVDNPEVTPLFYWVPCAGVRYYTYDYRPSEVTIRGVIKEGQRSEVEDSDGRLLEYAFMGNLGD